jgi:hypothetical protein
MGLFDDLVAQKEAPKGLFGDLVPARNEAPKNAFAEGVRQVGLLGRYAAEGLPQFADLVLTPARLAVNAVSGAFDGPRARTLSEEGGRLADAAGLPSPQTSTERVVGDATRTGFGAMGGAGMAKAFTRGAEGLTKAVAQKFAEAPGMQAVSGSAAGGAAGTVRENGGSPMGQFLASLGAGVAAPFAAGGVQRVGQAVAGAVREKLNPAQLDLVLKTELGKQGVDWAGLSAGVKMQLREDAKNAVYSGQPINAEALRRLADFRNIGATPLLGDITQDPRLLTLQRNLSKQLANVSNSVADDSLPNLANNNAKKVIGTLQGAAKSDKDAYATGEALINKVQTKDDILRGAENDLYAQARDAAGRDIPLARGQFVQSAYENLAKQNKTAFLPAEIGNLLDQISAGQIKRGEQTFEVPFNVNTIDTLKTTLAAASRASKDGNTRAAIAAVRDALENTQPMPIKRDFGAGQVVTERMGQQMASADDKAAEALKWFDMARGQARMRRNWQESAPFIEDALGGAAPDNFVKKHIISAPVDNLSKLKTEIGKDADLMNATRKQMVDYIMQRGRADADTTNFTSAGLKDGLSAIGDRKLALFFSPEEIQQLKSAVNVGRYMQSQPIGSAVNNSNSAAMLMGRLSDMMAKGSGVPVLGPMVASPMQGLALQASAIPLRNLSKGLATPAPSTAKPGAALVPLASLLVAPNLNQPQDDGGR